MNFSSIFGCPYNLHPESPWLRRTIRGTIATGVVIASPLIAVGAVTAAVTVLPTFGVYRLVKHVRTHRRARTTLRNAYIQRQFNLDGDLEVPDMMQESDLSDEIDDHIDMMLRLHQMVADRAARTREDDFPLSIFADMDVENLFNDGERIPTDAQVCPIIPSIPVRDDQLNVNQSNAEEHVKFSSPV